MVARAGCRPHTSADHSKSWCNGSFSDFPFYTCVHGTCVLEVITDCSVWKNSPFQNDPSARNSAEEVLPTAISALRCLNSRWRKKKSGSYPGDCDCTILSPAISTAGYEPATGRMNDPWGTVIETKWRWLNTDNCAPFEPMGRWILWSGGCCCRWNCILPPSRESPQPSEDSWGMKAGRVCPLPSRRFTCSKEGREPGIKWNILNEKFICWKVSFQGSWSYAEMWTNWAETLSTIKRRKEEYMKILKICCNILFQPSG